MKEEHLKEEHEKSIQKLKVKSLSPQVRIYNRNFYLRNAMQSTLQEEYEKSIIDAANTPKISAASYAILTVKLEEQLKNAIFSYEDSEKRLSFESFQKVAETFLSSKEEECELLEAQLWLVLCNYELREHVASSKVEALLRILFDPYALPPLEVLNIMNEFNEFKELGQKRKEFIEKYPELKDETYKLKKIIRLCYRIKANSLHIEDNKNKKVECKYSFQPEINQQSKNLAAHSLQKYLSAKRLQFIHQDDISHHEILHQRRLEKDFVQPREEIILKKGKTATPEEIKEITKNLYVKREKKENIDWKKIEEDKELIKCSFKPETKGYYKSKSPNLVKNFDSSVQRLEKGRKKKEVLKETYENMGKVKHTPRNSVAPSFIKRDEPKLILEVKIGDSRIEKINLKGDEVAKIVAKKFVIKHDLDSSMQSVLEDLIQQHLESL